MTQPAGAAKAGNRATHAPPSIKKISLSFKIPKHTDDDNQSVSPSPNNHGPSQHPTPAHNSAPELMKDLTDGQGKGSHPSKKRKLQTARDEEEVVHSAVNGNKKTNNGGNGPSQSDAEHGKRKKSRLGSKDATGDVTHLTDVQSQCQHLYDAIRYAKDESGRSLAEMFLELPSKTLYRDYYQVVQHPIALDVIKRKIEQGKYPTVADLGADMTLMFKNAQLYNIPGSEIYEDAVFLEKRVSKTVQKLTRKPEVPPVKITIKTNKLTDNASANNLSAEEANALFKAIETGDFKHVKKVVEKGFRLDTLYPTTMFGETFSWNVLHAASYHGKKQMVELFMDHGASVECPDTWYQGHALAWAAFGGYPEICKSLITKHGADASARNIHGQVAFDLVSDPENSVWKSIFTKRATSEGSSSSKTDTAGRPKSQKSRRNSRGPSSASASEDVPTLILRIPKAAIDSAKTEEDDGAKLSSVEPLATAPPSKQSSRLPSPKDSRVAQPEATQGPTPRASPPQQRPPTQSQVKAEPADAKVPKSNASEEAFKLPASQSAGKHGTIAPTPSAAKPNSGPVSRMAPSSQVGAAAKIATPAVSKPPFDASKPPPSMSAQPTKTPLNAMAGAKLNGVATNQPHPSSKTFAPVQGTPAGGPPRRPSQMDIDNRAASKNGFSFNLANLMGDQGRQVPPPTPTTTTTTMPQTTRRTRPSSMTGRTGDMHQKSTPMSMAGKPAGAVGTVQMTGMAPQSMAMPMTLSTMPIMHSERRGFVSSIGIVSNGNFLRLILPPDVYGHSVQADAEVRTVNFRLLLSPKPNTTYNVIVHHNQKRLQMLNNPASSGGGSEQQQIFIQDYNATLQSGLNVFE
ncbi:hypothetical protein HK102_004523, partial [Quaeritorhiza haematococci]